MLADCVIPLLAVQPVQRQLLKDYFDEPARTIPESELVAGMCYFVVVYAPTDARFPYYLMPAYRDAFWIIGIYDDFEGSRPVKEAKLANLFTDDVEDQLIENCDFFEIP
ncbi:MAG: hypothetical protein HUJ54_11770 [Erysipelotrichaceae bacterium]|nr:hypothetical protein [Erysipelotrichaceae bacterium]